MIPIPGACGSGGDLMLYAVADKNLKSHDTRPAAESLTALAALRMFPISKG